MPIAFTVAMLFGTLFPLAKAAPLERPNFIIIFCDDLGYADIGPFGSKKHRTPHLDRMAAEGRKFTSFYVTSGVCTPSRSSLMTGCYPKRVGLHQNETGRGVLFPGNQRGLNTSEITIAEVLKARGYATAIVGKWHLGDQPEFLPTRQGFDSYFGIPFSNDMGEKDRPTKQYPPLPLLRMEKVIEEEPDQRLITERYTREVIAFIERHKAKPFFLYLPHTMPHWPQYASERFAGKSANGKWGDTVEEIDWSTGEILKALKAKSLDEKTMVIFMSDNGGALHHGASNQPLRGGKGSTWEGGHRVPFVVRWPGAILPGTGTDALATSMDMLPTLAKLAGAKLPTDRKLDGRDITPLLLGKPGAVTPHKAFFFYSRGQLHAVRSGDWKLFFTRGKQKPNGEPVTLYNLADDIGETKNVLDEHPGLAKRLAKLAEGMRVDLGDDLTGVKGSGTREPGFVKDAKLLTKRK
ncbi:MAG: sulfatase [Verrucomicrobiota bacterium]|nr:sulfatase [Verrucomicrobiota bacterium]